jgi:hypothetical protein
MLVAALPQGHHIVIPRLERNAVTSMSDGTSHEDSRAESMQSEVDVVSRSMDHIC